MQPAHAVCIAAREDMNNSSQLGSSQQTTSHLSDEKPTRSEQHGPVSARGAICTIRQAATAQHALKQHCLAGANAAWHRACQGSQCCADARTSRVHSAYLQAESSDFVGGLLSAWAIGIPTILKRILHCFPVVHDGWCIHHMSNQCWLKSGLLQYP
jgi:hypothetical protein